MPFLYAVKHFHFFDLSPLLAICSETKCIYVRLILYSKEAGDTHVTDMRSSSDPYYVCSLFDVTGFSTIHRIFLFQLLVVFNESSGVVNIVFK